MKSECSRCDVEISSAVPVLICPNCVDEILKHNITEVFNDLENSNLDLFPDDVYQKIKQNHLSTFDKSKGT